MTEKAHGMELTRELARLKAEYARRSREIAPDTYSPGRPANLFIHQQLVRCCISLLTRHSGFPLNLKRIADIGCGGGTWLLEFAKWGASPCDLSGIDLDEEKILRAASRMPGADLRAGNASELPWGNESFHLVSQFTLFSSILSTPVRHEAAAEMLRVLKPGGLILWYDLRVNNPQNPAVRGIHADEIRILFPSCAVSLSSATLAPPLARRIVPLSWVLGILLEAIPFLRTHYVAVIQKPMNVDSRTT